MWVGGGHAWSMCMAASHMVGWVSGSGTLPWKGEVLASNFDEGHWTMSVPWRAHGPVPRIKIINFVRHGMHGLSCSCSWEI